MHDPMILVTRLAYKVPEAEQQLQEYLDDALTNYANAVTAHVRGVSEAIERFRSDPVNYRPDGLASLTENLRNASERFVELNREFARYASPAKRR